MSIKGATFDTPPSGFTRKGQERGCLVVGRSPDSAHIKSMKNKLAAQESQIAELREMVESLVSKKGKK